VYTLIYVAAANLRLQHRHEALAAVKQAVEITADDGLIMPFVENGEHIGVLLGEVGKIGRYAAFVARMKKNLYRNRQKKLPPSGRQRSLPTPGQA
jgi:hypothetical protein